MCSNGGNQTAQFQNALDSMSRKIVIYQEHKGSKNQMAPSLADNITGHGFLPAVFHTSRIFI